MLESLAIARFERRLVEMGYPSRPLRAKARELAEHYDDLKQAALEDGLTEQEAEKRAASRLGDPILLAESAAALLRQSSWWGRHPVIGFGLLPLLAFLPAWAVCLGCLVGLCWLLGMVFGPAYQFDVPLFKALSEEPKLFDQFVKPANAAVAFVALLLVVAVFYGLARRAAAGLKWVLVICGMCSLLGWFIHAGMQPHALVLGLGWPPRQWWQAAVPLLAAAAIYLRQRRQERRWSWVPMECQDHPRQAMPLFSRSRPVSRGIPTYWVMTVLTAGLLAVVLRYTIKSAPERARRAELISTLWPAERAATLALLKEGQLAKIPMAARTVNLEPFVNVSLNDCVGLVKENNLVELPVGIHTFAGVAFDIKGSIHLTGGAPDGGEEGFPMRVRIPVSGQCARFHVLHGARNLRGLDQEIARLVLRYVDGTSSRFEIVGGRQVLDWWGPIYQTEAGLNRHPTGPDTALAWAGSNPGIRARALQSSLRLYKTTFVNPHPELGIVGLDYLSMLKGPASFMVGLTLEPPSSLSIHP